MEEKEKEIREYCLSMVRGYSFDGYEISFISNRQRAFACIRRDMHDNSVLGLRIILTHKENKDTL